MNYVRIWSYANIILMALVGLFGTVALTIILRPSWKEIMSIMPGLLVLLATLTGMCLVIMFAVGIRFKEKLITRHIPRAVSFAIVALMYLIATGYYELVGIDLWITGTIAISAVGNVIMHIIKKRSD
ncbi:hypothetical protein D3C78_19560 [compost metagenome]